MAELTAPVPDGFPSGTLFNVEGGVSFDIKVLADFQKKIYNGFDTENEVEPGMWEEILRIINEATVEGISQSRAGYNEKDADFYSALRHSNEVFSTFKVHTFGVQMASKLFDDKGKLRSFDEWIKATIGISSHQVGSWLETEYNTAILRAHQAADWREFERNRDIFPNLRWMMTTSPDPEDTHKHYWMTGLTLPIDDPFWSKHYPGDRWNCKCSLESTDGPVVRPADIPEEKTIPGLDLNAGKTGCTFTCSHPYFPKDCSHCFAKRTVNGSAAVNGLKASLHRLFYNANEEKHCISCSFADAYLPIKAGYINDVEFGTRLRTSIEADMSEIEPNTRCAKSLLKSFPNMNIEIRPHIYSSNGIKNPEYLINGLIGDRKGVETEKGISSGFKKAIKQHCKVVVIDLDMHKDTIKILRSHDIAGEIANRFADFQNDIIKDCYVVWDDKAVVIRKEDFVSFHQKSKKANKEKLITIIEKIEE